MFLSDTDTAEVYDIINTLKSNKSPGPLKFSNHFLKLLNSLLISSLINRSFDESLMPEYLKIGKQTPVFKDYFFEQNNSKTSQKHVTIQ